MLIRDIMKKHVATITPSDSLGLAMQTMLWASVRHLPVLDRGKVVGVLSERDILRFRSQNPELPLTVHVDQAMSSPARYGAPDDSIDAVALRLANDRFGCLPIVEKGSLVGMVSTVDLLIYEAKQGFSAQAKAS